MKYAFKVLCHGFVISWFITGMLYFEMLADFNYNPLSLGNNEYYIWDKLSMFLIIICLLFPIRRMRKYFYIVLSLCFFRLVYEIPSIREWQQSLLGMDYFMLFIDIIHLLALGFIFYYDALMEDEKSRIRVYVKKHKFEDQNGR